MYSSIAVPIDLAHLDHLERTLASAADLASHYGARITYIGATSPQPTEVAASPQAFRAKLEALAGEEGRKHGIETAAHAIVTHDPTIDLSEHLVDAIKKVGADLVVMGSHKPGMADHLVTSHGSYVASHAPISVMVCR